MRVLWTILILTTIFLYSSQATEYYVDDVPVNGNGTAGSPFNSISSALSVAQPGDVIRVLPGTYYQKITSVRDGSAGQPITIRAHDPANRPLFTLPGEMMKLTHQHLVVDGLVLDAQFANDDIVRLENAHNLVIRNCEIRNAQKDGIDLEASDDVLIENSKIHHCLGGTLSSQKDAHGIVGVGQKNLTIRNCEIYYVSGDCFQSDPSRSNRMWDNVVIENSRLWTGPLPADAAGWNAGEIPGENAIDTKVYDAAGYRAKMTLRQVESFGFVPGYINNRAAFNLKENVDCFLDGVRVYDCEIAFRLRGGGGSGGAKITMINTIAYDNVKTFRTEDGLPQLWVLNSTFDIGSGDRYFQNAGGGYQRSGFDLRNCLFTGDKPDDAEDPSNLAANASFFENLSAHDYRLRSGSPAIDAGVDIALVTHDVLGNARPPGFYDVGAYEMNPSTGIDDDQSSRLDGFELWQNYPNPFNPSTAISYQISTVRTVKLHIYNMLGQLVKSLVNAEQSPGLYTVNWDGTNQYGEPVASGAYIYQIQAGEILRTRKMILQK